MPNGQGSEGLFNFFRPTPIRPQTAALTGQVVQSELQSGQTTAGIALATSRALSESIQRGLDRRVQAQRQQAAQQAFAEAEKLLASKGAVVEDTSRLVDFTPFAALDRGTFEQIAERSIGDPVRARSLADSLYTDRVSKRLSPDAFGTIQRGLLQAGMSPRESSDFIRDRTRGMSLGQLDQAKDRRREASDLLRMSGFFGSSSPTVNVNLSRGEGGDGAPAPFFESVVERFRSRLDPAGGVSVKVNPLESEEFLSNALGINTKTNPAARDLALSGAIIGYRVMPGRGPNGIDVSFELDPNARVDKRVLAEVESAIESTRERLARSVIFTAFDAFADSGDLDQATREQLTSSAAQFGEEDQWRGFVRGLSGGLPTSMIDEGGEPEPARVVPAPRDARRGADPEDAVFDRVREDLRRGPPLDPLDLRALQRDSPRFGPPSRRALPESARPRFTPGDERLDFMRDTLRDLRRE